MGLEPTNDNSTGGQMRSVAGEHTGQQEEVRHTDHEIIRRYQRSRDPSDLNELVDRHLERVRRLVFEMVLDDTVADDCTQEVFLRVVRGLNSFRGNAQFSTWLYRVTMNTVYSYLKRQRPVAPLEETSEPRSSGAAPDEASMQSELVGEIEAAVRDLSPKLRAAIVLTSLHHKSPQEAAQIEGCTAGTMYWRIHEARKQLKHTLHRHLK